MVFSIWFDTMIMGQFIVHIKGKQIRITMSMKILNIYMSSVSSLFALIELV